jgi:hypothetical protein
MNQQLYSTSELAAMNAEELRRAQANGFVKRPEDDPAFRARANEALPPVPPQAMANPDANPYAITAWGTDLYDFVVPSGQRCQLRRLRPEKLLGTGLLDKMTRLPGFADEQIRKAEGQPPVQAMPTGEQLEQVMEVLNELLPVVVVQPHLSVLEPGADREPDRVYVDDVDLFDAIAIMNRVTSGVAKLDNFREES